MVNPAITFDTPDSHLLQRERDRERERAMTMCEAVVCCIMYKHNATFYMIVLSAFRCKFYHALNCQHLRNVKTKALLTLDVN